MLSKILLFIVVATLMEGALAVCQTRVNNQKVMLFIDTNYSDMEIATAEKAACTRGERFVVIPKDYKKITSHIQVYEAANKKYEACRNLNKLDDLPYQDAKKYCETERKNKEQSYLKVNEQARSMNLQKQIDEGMAELNKEKVKITSVSISGHDGGGHFGGYKGSFSREQMASYLSKYPDMNDIQSILLLGCYTGVQDEVAQWRGILPKAKLIAGYDGSAPLSTRTQGHDYIRNILLKEKAIISLKNDRTVDDDLKGMLAGLEKLNSALFVDTQCQNDGDGLYYSSMGGRTFNKLELNECQKAMIEFAKIEPQYNKYHSGELEPPTQTGAGTPLRTIYNSLRTNGHCLSRNLMGGGMGSRMNVNDAFNLLFWHGVKQNFAKYYEDDLLEAEKILATLDIQDIIKSLEEDAEIAENKFKKYSDMLETYKKDPEELKKSLKGDLEALEEEVKQLSARKEFQDAIQKLSLDPNAQLTPEEQKLIAQNSALQIKKSESSMILNQMERYPNHFSQTLEMYKDSAEQQMTAFKAHKITVSDPDYLKKLFIPTPQNIQQKTRQEIMENTHRLTGLSMLRGLTPKQRGALNFVSSASDNHLRYFKNPFSWHEYSDLKPEAPEETFSLKKSIDMYQNLSPTGTGMFGGYPAGGIGGSGGGFGGGQQQLQNPLGQ